MLILSSHSDPNISRTLEVFSKVPDYIRSLAEDLGGIRQSIVRSVCQSEAPEHASMRGLLSFYNHMAGVPPELEQQRREERMATGPEHYFAFAEVVQQALSEASFVVLGSRKEIEEAEAHGLSVRSSAL